MVADSRPMPTLTTANGLTPPVPSVWSYRDLLRAELERPAQLVEPFFQAGTGAFIAGPPNVGKTWLLLSLLVAVAGGTPWLGTFATTAGRVLFIDEESTAWHTQERLQMLAMGGLLGDDLPLAFVIGEGLRVDTDDGFARIDDLMRQHRPSLVAADSLIRLHGAEENNSGQMADVFASVKRLMAAHGAAFLFTDHARKKSLVGNDPEEMQRGSSEKRAWADSILYVSPGDEGGVTVAHTKARYAARHPDFRVELQIGDGAAGLRYAGAAARPAGGAKLTEIVAAIHAVKTQLGPDASSIDVIAGQAECSAPTARKYLILLE